MKSSRAISRVRCLYKNVGYIQTLMPLIAREDFTEFSRRESCTSYINYKIRYWRNQCILTGKIVLVLN